MERGRSGGTGDGVARTDRRRELALETLDERAHRRDEVGVEALLQVCRRIPADRRHRERDATLRAGHDRGRAGWAGGEASRSWLAGRPPGSCGPPSPGAHGRATGPTAARGPRWSPVAAALGPRRPARPPRAGG